MPFLKFCMKYYQLNKQIRVILKNLRVTQVVKKILALHVSRGLNTAFTGMHV